MPLHAVASTPKTPLDRYVEYIHWLDRSISISQAEIGFTLDLTPEEAYKKLILSQSLRCPTWTELSPRRWYRSIGAGRMLAVKFHATGFTAAIVQEHNLLSRPGLVPANYQEKINSNGGLDGAWSLVIDGKFGPWNARRAMIIAGGTWQVVWTDNSGTHMRRFDDALQADIFRFNLQTEQGAIVSVQQTSTFEVLA